MDFEELKIINIGIPSKALLYKALMENEGVTDFYKEQLKNDKRPYWKGKILYQAKQKKLIVAKFEEIHKVKIINP